MCLFGEKNFFDTPAEVLSDALFDLVTGDSFAAFVHKKRRSADSKGISNGFCVQLATQSAQLVADCFVVPSCGAPPFCALIVLKCTKEVHSQSAQSVLEFIVHFLCLNLCTLCAII